MFAPATSALPTEEDVIRVLLLDDVQYDGAGVPTDDGSRPETDIEVGGDVPSGIEQLLLPVNSLLLEGEVLRERRLPGDLDDVHGDDFGLIVFVGVSARRGHSKEVLFRLRIRNRNDHAIAVFIIRHHSRFGSDRFTDETLAQSSVARVHVVPPDTEEDEERPDCPDRRRSNRKSELNRPGCEGHRDKIDRHLHENGQTGKHPDDRNDRIQNRRNLKGRIVRVRIRSAQDDDGHVNESVRHEIHEARHLGERADPDTDSDQHQGDDAGRRDRPVGRSKPLVNFVEPVDENAISAHCEINTSGREDARVRARHCCQDGTDDHRQRTDRAHELGRHVSNRNL